MQITFTVNGNNVTLEAAPKPGFAWLDVEFWNDHALAPLPPKEAKALFLARHDQLVKARGRK